MESQSGTARSLLQLAVIGSIVLNVLSLPIFAVLPGSDDVPAGVLVVGIVFAVAALVGAYGLWNRKRWGYWATFVITALNILSSVPGIAEWPSNAIGIAIIITVVLGIALLVLMRKPEVRQQVA